ncbi:MAG: aldolase [Gammaproteobacteria bacterium]|nr:aldolase [Gammaproteobacteria bacterium]
MSLKLMLLASEPGLALEAERAGVDRVFYDLEFLNKRERQRGRNTVISNNTVEGISSVRAVLNQSELLVRTNPVNPYLADEVDRCVDSGADILMLPMAIDRDDALAFVNMVNGRAKVSIMIETPQAFCRLHDICAVDGIDEIFIGLNDLHIGMKLTFMFEVLSGGLVEYMAGVLKRFDLPFGFGGIAKIGEGLLPADNILGEHYRLGSQAVILSRTFQNHPDVTSSASSIDLKHEVGLVRQRESEIRLWSNDAFQANKKTVCEKTHEIASLINANSHK